MPWCASTLMQVWCFAYAEAMNAAALSQSNDHEWKLTGGWTVHSLGTLGQPLDVDACAHGDIILNGEKLEALDSAGAWVLHVWLQRHGAAATLQHWPPRMQALMEQVGAYTQLKAEPKAGPNAEPQAQQNAEPNAKRSDNNVTVVLTQPPLVRLLANIGRSAYAVGEQALALLTFTGQTATTALNLIRHPTRIRWRAVLHNIQIGGFEALPIVGLTAFLLGVVVAYQGADQLKNYGANIFVVELVGYSMLREFAPLITAIIVAGRSGSAFSAQIGTMVVTDEIDALRTIDIDPTELLVLPKIAGLLIALPLLTVFADICGVFGGMVMARSQLGIGFYEFLDRFGREVDGSAFLVGVGKSLVFAVIIAGVGCFQGFRTVDSADSVGRQTTTSVVQSIFLVIVVDALFSVVFNILNI